jgi:hypothetical protein
MQSPAVKSLFRVRAGDTEEGVLRKLIALKRQVFNVPVKNQTGCGFFRHKKQ